MERFLIDTDILISHIRGFEKATEFLSSDIEVTISYVTVGELLQGVVTKKDLSLVKDLIDSFEVDLGSQEISALAIQLLKNNVFKSLRILDALIAATALHNDIPLVTENTKHFKNIPDLRFLTLSDTSNFEPIQ